jgi:hypothetical protein
VSDEIEKVEEDTLSGRVADVWAEYQAAARQLEAARRAATKVVAEQSNQLIRARTELASLQTRLSLQRNRLHQAALSIGSGLPELEATVRPNDPATNLPHQRAPQSPIEAFTAITRARASADTVDAILTTVEQSTTGGEPAGPPLARRNAYVYGGFALVFAIVQIPFVVAVLSESFAGTFALCGLVMPFISFGLAWATIGMLYPRQGAVVDRTPILGAVISAAAAVPLFLLVLLAFAQAAFR